MDQYITQIIDREKFYPHTNESLARAMRGTHYRDQACFTVEADTSWQLDPYKKFERMVKSSRREWRLEYNVLTSSMYAMWQDLKCHFMTDQGRLGVTLANVQSSEIVVALFSGKVLYLLRLILEGRHNAFVSEYYLYFTAIEVLRSNTLYYKCVERVQRTAYLSPSS